MVLDSGIKIGNDLVLISDITNPLVLPEELTLEHEEAYKEFEEWFAKNNMGSNEVNEKHLMVYFNEKAKIQPSTYLRSTFNMLRSVMTTKKNIDIQEYKNLVKILEKKLQDITKTNPEFLARHIDIFMEEADDEWALAMKVLVIVRVAGGLYRPELQGIRVDDVIDEGYNFRICTRNKRGKIWKEFIITGELSLKLIRKYLNLRPDNLECKNFFVAFNNGAYLKRPLSNRIMTRIPRMVEKFVTLPNPRMYTSLQRWYDSQFSRSLVTETENM